MLIEMFVFAMTFWESLIARLIAFFVNLFFGRAYDMQKKKLLKSGMNVWFYKVIASLLMLVAKIQINSIVYGSKAMTGHHVDIDIFLKKVALVSLIALICSFPSRKLFVFFKGVIGIFEVFSRLKEFVRKYNPVLEQKKVEFVEYGIPPYGIFVHCFWIPIINSWSPKLHSYDRHHLKETLSQ
jgi:hypothetical protein